MKFQLLKLVVWPKDSKFSPRTIDFRPGVLNVITGESRTGKSAIIPIIDYCLAASDCLIPIDTIRDYASWYGVVFQTETEDVLLARRAPAGVRVSNDFYILRSKMLTVPPVIADANEKSEGVKHILNTISGVPYFALDGDRDERAFQARLGFRDLMALVFQSQDIVANQNILFYKTHAHEHRERLRNWFPFILGAENMDILTARQRLQVLEQRLRQLQREFEKLREHSASWVNNIRSHLNVASQYGLLDQKLKESDTPEDLLLIAEQIIANIPEHSRTKQEDIKTASKELSELEFEEDLLAS